mmetsp:Transcript_20842/g.28764  ORF Transcript_20842/g.28764 Transcript_20842/m.28764 type:complete len:221 (-) Transcript_20842:241-903(-)
MQYLKDMRNDQISIMMSQQLQDFLAECKVAPNELYKLQGEQLTMFRHILVEQRNHHEQYCKNSPLMDKLLSIICLIVTRKVPVDCAPFKVELISSKIKFVSPPADINREDRTEQGKPNEEGQTELVKITKNTNERALVRVCIPKARKTQSEVDITSQAESNREARESRPVSQEKKEPIETLVEMDQDDKGLSICTRNALPYSIHVIHHTAARCHRAEVIN